MKTKQTISLLTMLSAWIVYGICQKDVILPFIASVLALSLFFKKIAFKRNPSQSSPPPSDDHLLSSQPISKMSDPSSHPTRRIPWVNLVGISLTLGWIWRNFLIEDQGNFSPIGIMQTTFVFLSLLIWFRQNYFYRDYALKFISWILVALSINVRFDPPAFIAFAIFCLLNTFFIFLYAHSPIPTDTVKNSREFKNKYLFSSTVYLTVLLTLCLGFFLFFVQFVKLSDRAFMLFIQEYFFITPHELLEFGQVLDLSGPGYVGRDIRPILEIDRHQPNNLYLTTQIFEHYQNGIWKRAKQSRRRFISNRQTLEKEGINLILFNPLKGIIPVPDHVIAVKGNDQIFEQDENGIITSPDGSALKATLFLGQGSSFLTLNEERKIILTDLSPLLKEHLTPYVDTIAEDKKNPWEIAQAIERYFQENFEYRLDTRFGANEKGLLTMLKEKRPAYCSYFASAMVLMLRSQGIPARLKAGFLASETIDKNKKFLVRIRDAHAWVEALLPVEGKPGVYQRVNFDPTPPMSRLVALDMNRPLNPCLDWLWRSQRRLRAELVSMDTSQLTMNLLIIVLIFVVTRNLKEIVEGLKSITLFQRTNTISDSQNEQTCRRIYESFEELLQKNFQCSRKDSETDEELVQHLRKQPMISPETLSLIESFLNKYHAVRFGERVDYTLENDLKEIERLNAKVESTK